MDDVSPLPPSVWYERCHLAPSLRSSDRAYPGYFGFFSYVDGCDKERQVSSICWRLSFNDLWINPSFIFISFPFFGGGKLYYTLFASVAQLLCVFVNEWMNCEEDYLQVKRRQDWGTTCVFLWRVAVWAEQTRGLNTGSRPALKPFPHLYTNTQALNVPFY